ncbi:MAG: CinA family protein [Dehalococcoidia bacterium]|nr:CinA family protein [Dehalococcoidia bacterium]
MDEIVELVAKLLQQKRKRIAVVEATGCGLVMHRLATIPGASRYLDGGVVAYSYPAKQKMLGLSDTDLAQGSVSHEAAQAMARRIRQLVGTDIGLADTGMAGPTGTPEKPPGLVFIALSAPATELWERHQFPSNDRVANQRRTADAAFDLLKRYLESLPGA